MTRTMIAAAGLCLLIGGVPAAAKNAVDPRVQAALACSSVAQDQQRLRCYDQALATLRQAVEAGLLDSEPAPVALEGTIKASGGSGFNRFWVELDSGDRWQVTASSSDDPLPRKGAKVTFRKGLVGGYRFSEPYMPERPARYLGRS